MANLLAMFPGQGSQFVGMGRSLLAEFPAARVVFEEAEDACKVSIRRLCLEGPEEDLKLTANTQPCILTHSIAVWRVLTQEAGIEPSLFAGHSLGEYSALVAAGKLELGRAAFLVRKRGEAMQEAVPAGVGAMAAVLNVEAAELKDRCNRLSSNDRQVEVVNFNSPQQLVVAGHKTAVDDLCRELETEGRRYVSLPVSAPFHSSLMRPARDAMEPLLLASTFAATANLLVANLTGKVAADYGPKHLIEQICSPVLWTQSLASAEQHGCDTFLEIGPGKVLAGLARKTLARGATIRHTDDLPQTLKDLQARAP